MLLLTCLLLMAFAVVDVPAFALLLLAENAFPNVLAAAYVVVVVDTILAVAGVFGVCLFAVVGGPVVAGGPTIAVNPAVTDLPSTV